MRNQTMPRNSQLASHGARRRSPWRFSAFAIVSAVLFATISIQSATAENKIIVLKGEPDSPDAPPKARPTPLPVVVEPTATPVPAGGPPASPTLPKSGVLSRSLIDVSDSRSVGMPVGGVDAQGGEAAPISGSVSRLSAREWKMRVFNNTDETYSVSLEVEQRSASGTRIKGDSYSYTLKGKESKEQQIAAYANTVDCILTLKSWRRVGGR